jgi:YgiT-type zinc finger domain-containing protein
MMQCDLCGDKAAVIKKTTKSFGRGNKLVVIENIPTVHCSHCHRVLCHCRYGSRTRPHSQEPSQRRKSQTGTRRIVQEKRGIVIRNLLFPPQEEFVSRDQD